jgi:hypothetical protein
VLIENSKAILILPSDRGSGASQSDMPKANNESSAVSSQQSAQRNMYHVSVHQSFAQHSGPSRTRLVLLLLLLLQQPVQCADKPKTAQLHSRTAREGILSIIQSRLMRDEGVRKAWPKHERKADLISTGNHRFPGETRTESTGKAPNARTRSGASRRNLTVLSTGTWQQAEGRCKRMKSARIAAVRQARERNNLLSQAQGARGPGWMGKMVGNVDNGIF